jgi:hypothetical protein
MLVERALVGDTAMQSLSLGHGQRGTVSLFEKCLG